MVCDNVFSEGDQKDLSLKYSLRRLPLDDDDDDSQYDDEFVEGSSISVKAIVDEESRNVGTKRQVRGAGVAGGLIGLFLGGPILAAVAGFGAAWAAKTSDSKAGRIVRRSGDSVANAGDRIREWNREHRLSERAKMEILRGYNFVSDQLGESSRISPSSSSPRGPSRRC